MPDRGFQKRVWITAALLAAAIVVLQGVSHGERVPLCRPLAGIPLLLGDWQGQEAPLEGRIVEAAGVDDYVNRIYSRPGAVPVGMYVGYYSSQRTGDTIHSPRNCLPGTGWQPLRSGRLEVTLPGKGPMLVNEYLVAKGLERELVLYWYQARGRVVASEYSAKLWMVVDAITRNRTDAALVRLITPVPEGDAQARARALEFARLIYPHLREFIPE